MAEDKITDEEDEAFDRHYDIYMTPPDDRDAMRQQYWEEDREREEMEKEVQEDLEKDRQSLLE